MPAAAAAAAAKSASVVSDSVQPHRQHPIRVPRPWDPPGQNTGVGCHFLLQCMKVKSESEVTQSCLTLSNPRDCSPPGSSVHGIFQARVLEFQLQHQSFQWIFRIDFLKDWLVWYPFSPRDSQESFPTPQSKSINSSALSFLYSLALTSTHDCWKNHSLD